MSGPEEALFWPCVDLAHQLAQDEAFPRGADLRVTIEIVASEDSQKCVQQPGIRDEHLRRLHLTFAEVLVPWLQDTNDQSADQQIEVPSNGSAGDTQGPG